MFKTPDYIKEVLDNQYFQPSDKGDFTRLVDRVVDFVVGAEVKFGTPAREIKAFKKEMREAILTKKWIPSTPFLMNAGTQNPMLFACFVLGIDDSISSIFQSLHDAALIHKMGGGTGFDLSKIRGRGTPVSSTGGKASGVLSFMQLFDCEAEVIKQGGKRRSANLGSLRIDHPEIIDFINAKVDKKKFQNFNLSIQIPDWFMRKVTGEDPDPTYHVRDGSGEPTNLVGKDTGKLDAREVFNLMVSNSWACGDPGVLFVDAINRANPMLGDHHIIRTTNPCGEIPLEDHEACNLTSINLSEFVVQNGDDEPTVDWIELGRIVANAIRFMDDAIEVSSYPLPEIEKKVKYTRKLGLGIMGLQGMLIKLGLAYDTPEATEKASEVMKYINDVAFETSTKLAESRGVPEGWYESKYCVDGIKVRNLTRTCIAPTGTISMILDAVSSGCEPIFALVYKRNILGQIKNMVNPLFREIGEQEGWLTEEVIEKVAKNRGRATGVDEIPAKWQRLFITAREIDPKDHVAMQAALQPYVDNSISKTVNIPQETEVSAVKDIIIRAWSMGCKGITIYRDGSLTGVLTTEKVETLDAGTRPELLIGLTTKIQSGCGKIWVTINPYKGRIREVFATAGSDGGCTANIQTISRLISSGARHNIPIQEIIDQLKSVKCSRAIANNKCRVQSCSDAIARQLEQFLALYRQEEWDDLLNKLNERVSSLQDKTVFLPKIEVDGPIISLEELNKASGCRSGYCG